MAFSSGNSSATSAEINVTPLIDILLVLLIIFMVIVPVMPRGLSALLPQPPKGQTAAVPERPIVVQVHASPTGVITYQVNQQNMEKAGIGEELSRMLAGRQDKAIFVRGDRDLEFSAVAEVIGFGRQANADRIGILTPEMEAGR